MKAKDKAKQNDPENPNFETFYLSKDYVLSLFNSHDPNKASKKENQNHQKLMKEFMKQLDNTSCRNDILAWLKSLDKQMLYRVFCIEGQTWLVATLLKMFWKLQENQNYKFAISIQNQTSKTDTKDLIKQMPIALP